MSERVPATWKSLDHSRVRTADLFCRSSSFLVASETSQHQHKCFYSI